RDPLERPLHCVADRSGATHDIDLPRVEPHELLVNRARQVIGGGQDEGSPEKRGGRCGGEGVRKVEARGDEHGVDSRPERLRGGDRGLVSAAAGKTGGAVREGVRGWRRSRARSLNRRYRDGAIAALAIEVLLERG